MRLIDADKLKEKALDGCDVIHIDTIDGMPAAYDVDKVVEELTRDKSVRFTDSFDSNTYTISLIKAIEIVKRGVENVY